jgi:hypothetical protein
MDELYYWQRDAKEFVEEFVAEGDPGETREECYTAMKDSIIEGLRYRKGQIDDLLWDEKIDDAEGDRLKEKAKAETDVYLAAIEAWYANE